MLKLLILSVLLLLIVADVQCQIGKILGGAKVIEDEELISEIIQKMEETMQALPQVESLTVVQADKVEQQVVGGMKYTISGIFEGEDGKQFESEISMKERPWMPLKRVSFSRIDVIVEDQD